MWTLKNMPAILFIVGNIVFWIFVFWAAGQIGDQAHQTIYHRDEAQRKHDDNHKLDDHNPTQRPQGAYRHHNATTNANTRRLGDG